MRVGSYSNHNFLINFVICPFFILLLLSHTHVSLLLCACLFTFYRCHRSPSKLSLKRRKENERWCAILSGSSLGSSRIRQVVETHSRDVQRRSKLRGTRTFAFDLLRRAFRRRDRNFLFLLRKLLYLSLFPAMQKWFAKLRGKGSEGKKTPKQRSPEPRKAESQPEPTPTSSIAPPPPHLPALDFSPPLTTVDLAPDSPPPTTEQSSTVDSSPRNQSTSRSSSSLPQLQPTTTLSPSIIPPTPIDPSPLSKSISRCSTPPPLVSSPIASSSSLQPVNSSPSPAGSSHLIPPPSPNLGRTSRSGSPARRGHHRRSSSTGSRSFRETLNAYAVEDSNGQRFVNQYKIGTPQGPLGRGTYAVVEKAVDRETNTEYVSFFSLYSSNLPSPRSLLESLVQCTGD